MCFVVNTVTGPCCVLLLSGYDPLALWLSLGKAGLSGVVGEDGSVGF